MYIVGGDDSENEYNGGEDCGKRCNWQKRQLEAMKLEEKTVGREVFGR